MVTIAIDGPGGAGKSTIARAAARQLGYIYVDTGALYRAIGLHMLRRGISLDDPAAIAENVGSAEVSLAFREGEQIILLGSENVGSQIRTPEVSMAASAVSAVPAVRARLLELQRQLATENNVIMDGRDIGTVVLPNASVKIFLTADAEVRARRRYDELIEKGEPVEFEQVLSELIRRDEQDSNRAAAPLKKAEDAVLLDTTQMTLQQSIDAVVRLAGQAR